MAVNDVGHERRRSAAEPAPDGQRRAAPEVRPELPRGRNINAPRAGRRGTSRGTHEFERARRHSTRVRILKFALPAIGIAALLAVIGSMFFAGSGLPAVNLEGLRLEKGKLVMESPKLSGLDEAKRPYKLSAIRALQDTDAPSRISLEGISAELPFTDQEFARIEAQNGLYDADNKTLDLGGSISVDTDTGMSLRMQDANIDIESGRMRSDNPVEVKTERIQINANGLTVEDNGESITFTGGIEMTILPYEEDVTASTKRD